MGRPFQCALYKEHKQEHKPAGHNGEHIHEVSERRAPEGLVVVHTVDKGLEHMLHEDTGPDTLLVVVVVVVALVSQLSLLIGNIV